MPCFTLACVVEAFAGGGLSLLLIGVMHGEGAARCLARSRSLFRSASISGAAPNDAAPPQAGRNA